MRAPHFTSRSESERQRKSRFALTQEMRSLSGPARQLDIAIRHIARLPVEVLELIIAQAGIVAESLPFMRFRTQPGLDSLALSFKRNPFQTGVTRRPFRQNSWPYGPYRSPFTVGPSWSSGLAASPAKKPREIGFINDLGSYYDSGSGWRGLF